MSWWRPTKDEDLNPDIVQVNIPPAEDIRKKYPTKRFSKWEEKILGAVVLINTLAEDSRLGSPDPDRAIVYSAESQDEMKYVAKRFAEAGYEARYGNVGFNVKISW